MLLNIGSGDDELDHAEDGEEQRQEAKVACRRSHDDKAEDAQCGKCDEREDDLVNEVLDLVFHSNYLLFVYCQIYVFVY